ncbi:saccharopine dehydrogenase [Nocardia cyriacigeorgica]|uniref:Saccharopine dehydrogenase n=1 Tax=Nocardia cyriacigeorgica TaxID=135487 RepID=A0A6P1D9R9_9NOCA|nr:saccharopine dehydrogenase [Nocardia cyriacigeorgica]NEW45042.1 saccharopine dehydrogenase [Nocardia cyriacigeorgica]NEW55114.1 saccharopine dehydrogenase [Nocardia cyriacigeorgica]
MDHRKPVLLLGGSGQAGSDTAAHLRRWHPELPLTIAGRNPARAQRVADELGGATAITIDLTRRDLGLPAGEQYAAVVATVWDSRLNGLRFAQDHGAPYASLSSGMIDIAPEITAGTQRPAAAPVLMASHWAAGVITLVALEWAKEFDRVDTIRIGAILDENDAGGPAGLADLERWAEVTSAGYARRDGVFAWIGAAEAQVELHSLDGTAVTGQTVPILDVTSLGLATGAPNVEFAFAVGESAGSRRGEGPSVEIRIDLEGLGRSGAPLTINRHVVHLSGQRPLTSLGLALGVERLLGLRGDAVTPGIYTPEVLLDSAYVVEQLVDVGTSFVDV